MNLTGNAKAPVHRDRLIGVGAITTTSILWGTTGTAATFAPAVGPIAIGAAALGVGGLLQALIAVGPLREARRALRTHAQLIGLGAVAVAIYPLAFYSAMHLAGVAVGRAVSLASAPLASGAIELWVDGRRLSWWWMAAAALGVVGCVLLCVSKFSGDHNDALATILGLVLGLVAGATYATYSWAAQRLMGHGVSRAASMGAVFGVGGALLIPVLLLTGAPLVASPTAFAVATYMAIVPMFLGYVLFGIGLSKVPASTATTITLSEPAVATVLAVWIVGERLTAVGWIGLTYIGIVLVMLALAPTNASGRNRTAP